MNFDGITIYCSDPLESVKMSLLFSIFGRKVFVLIKLLTRLHRLCFCWPIFHFVFCDVGVSFEIFLSEKTASAKGLLTSVRVGVPRVPRRDRDDVEAAISTRSRIVEGVTAVS